MLELDPDHLQEISAVLTTLAPDCEVWVFGSRARHTSRRHSDLDLALRGENPLPWRTLAALRESFQASSLPYRVDVVDWHALPESLRLQIAEHGVPL